jgi:transcriptional regulator with XRE-family HTH domain
MLAAMKTSKKQPTAREVFARNVRRVRRLKELSQEELALRADLSRTYVSEVERGIRNVSIDNMGLIAQSLGTPLQELLDPSMFSSIDNQVDQ